MLTTSLTLFRIETPLPLGKGNYFYAELQMYSTSSCVYYFLFRCLSAMSLASKCMEPAFRMHLRAHSTVAKFFQALKDAPSKAVSNSFVSGYPLLISFTF